MPCYDGRDADEATRSREEERKLEAMLCGLLRALKATGRRKEVLAAFDETAAGVTVIQMLTWDRAHVASDRTGGRNASGQ